jgi:hypothetical protein
MSIQDVSDKLRRYARLAIYAPERGGDPAWRAVYPHVFPAVLLVLTGADRERLLRRRQLALALAARDPLIAAVRELAIYCVLLDDLRVHGPFAPILRRQDQPSAGVDVLGRPG